MALPLAYNWHNLFVRKLSTALTFIVVAVVVLVLAVLMSFAAGVRASLASSGRPNNLLVLHPGATAETTSVIDLEKASRLVQTPGLARDAAGRLLISQESCIQTCIPRRDPRAALANVAVRGVSEIAFAIHEEVRIIEGRCFQPSAWEAIVGQAAKERFAGLRIGDEISIGRLNNRKCKIVGVFAAGAGAMESEIWIPQTVLADAYRRRFISSAVLRLEDERAADAAIAYVNGPSVNLVGKRETDYYKEFSAKAREIGILTIVLMSIMAVGAVFAVANTMYAAVDGRRREIAMLRTIGFSRRAIMAAFVIESLMICLLACAFGLGISLTLHGTRQDYLSEATWTVLAYELRFTPGIMLSALLLACFVGIAGAMAPALRAARIGVIEALRKT